MLINSSEPYESAEKNKYAIGHFNIMNLETFQALINASIKKREYVFMGCSMTTIKYMGLDNIINLSRSIPKKARIILHLDHGNMEYAKKCIKKEGFTSVMYDGSKLPFEKNVKNTKKIVKMAYKKNISVEAELGRLVGTEDEINVSEREKSMTKPEKAEEFVERTGCHSLAVSIGTGHGFYKGEPVIDFERLEKINNVVDIPLVLHGASGLPDNEIRIAIKKGIRKINIDSELRWSFAQAVHQYMKKHGLMRTNKDSFDLRNILGEGREAYEKQILKKIKLFRG